jgi:ABC-2 type transport system ATP-binding protein
MPDKSIIVDSLTKRFGDFTAVDSITFEVGAGEVFGFLGANGAGKTTAIRMLTGLSRPTSGHASVAGFDVTSQTEQVKTHIGYMSQKFSLYQDLSIRQNIRFYGGVYGLSKRKIKDKERLIENDLSLEGHMDKVVADLPLGWKQRLAFAVAGVHDPGIIFLDEPTGGVDPLTRRQFWEMIYASAQRGVTVFVTTHYMDEAEYCDRVSIMVAGKIHALGTPRELKDAFSASSMNDVFLKLARQ